MEEAGGRGAQVGGFPAQKILKVGCNDCWSCVTAACLIS